MRFLTVLVVCVLSFQALASDPGKKKKSEAVAIKPRVTNIQEVMGGDIYPVQLRKEGIEGEVIVEVLLDEAGAVLEYKVSHTSNEMLEKLVTERLELLQFEPAKNALGMNVQSKTKLPFQFTLDVD